MALTDRVFYINVQIIDEICLKGEVASSDQFEVKIRNP